MQINLRDITINISEHHGDASPGSAISITDFTGLEAYQQLLISKQYKFMRPGIERVPWDKDVIEMIVIDPFYNRIIFSERV